MYQHRDYPLILHRLHIDGTMDTVVVHSLSELGALAELNCPGYRIRYIDLARKKGPGYYEKQCLLSYGMGFAGMYAYDKHDCTCGIKVPDAVREAATALGWAAPPQNLT